MGFVEPGLQLIAFLSDIRESGGFALQLLVESDLQLIVFLSGFRELGGFVLQTRDSVLQLVAFGGGVLEPIDLEPQLLEPGLDVIASPGDVEYWRRHEPQQAGHGQGVYPGPRRSLDGVQFLKGRLLVSEFARLPACVEGGGAGGGGRRCAQCPIVVLLGPGLNLARLHQTLEQSLVVLFDQAKSSLQFLKGLRDTLVKPGLGLLDQALAQCPVVLLEPGLSPSLLDQALAQSGVVLVHQAESPVVFFELGVSLCLLHQAAVQCPVTLLERGRSPSKPLTRL